MFVARAFTVIFSLLACDVFAQREGPLMVDETTYLVATNGRQIFLQNNPDARDPSVDEVMRFLRMDGTDKLPYQEGAFDCTEFALSVHDAAERAGLRAAYVFVEFGQGDAHALNAFRTRDYGLVFVDSTGSIEPLGEGQSNDAIAYVVRGRPLGLLSLAAARGGPAAYSHFERMQQEQARVERRVAELEREAQELERMAAEGNRMLSRMDRRNPASVARYNEFVSRHAIRTDAYNAEARKIRAFTETVRRKFTVNQAPVRSVQLFW